jgi:pyruvate/oxaloacetate carboxyltransferase
MAAAKAVLDPLSNKQRFEVLKGLLGLYGMKPVSVNAPVARPQNRSERAKADQAPRKRASPAIKALRSEISDLNKKITERSQTLGKSLSADDDLIVARSRLFLRLKELQNKTSSSADKIRKEEEKKNDSTAVATLASGT